MIRFLQTPGQAKKYFLGGILMLICLSMVWYLVPSSGNISMFGGAGGQQGIVATVDGDPISTQQVLRQAQLIERQQFQGKDLGARFLPYFAKQATETLVTQRALLAAAQQLGLRVTDDELSDELQHGELASTLFPGGKFIGQVAYENFAASNNLTVAQLEEIEKNAILMRKLRSLISSSASVADAEVEKEFRRRNTKVKFDYALLSPDTIRKGIHPTEVELKAFYERNKPAYNNAIPEKRKIRFAAIENAKVVAQVKVSAQDLQSYYQQRQDDYRVPDQVKARHILVATPAPSPGGKVDEKVVTAARAKAESILKQVKAGGDFAKLAEKNSDDPGSAKKGGDLGWFQHGAMVPEFDRAAFSMAKGQTSDLVQSSFGFHIIRVDDKQAAHLKSLDEVKPQIEPILMQQIAARQSEAQGNALLGEARKSGLEKAAAARGLNVVSTDFVAQADAVPGIGPAPEVMNAVFGAREKSPPEMAQAPSGYVVYEIVAIKPPATPGFDEIRSRVESEFQNERVNTLLAQKTQEISDRARAAHDLKKVAKELGAELKTSEFVLPTGQVPGIGSLAGAAQVVFSMKPGEISGPINAGSNGAVIFLREVQPPEPSEFAAKKSEVRESLMESRREEVFAAFAESYRDKLKKAGKIKINEDQLKTLTRGSLEEGL
jgi:peptidyl-prolyl cis-trans isomerase D